MHLGNLKRMHMKIYCNVINIVILEDVCAGKEETTVNLIGMTFPGRCNLGWNSSLVVWWCLGFSLVFFFCLMVWFWFVCLVFNLAALILFSIRF